MTVEEARETADEIARVVEEDVHENARDKNASYFDDVVRKSEDIAASCEDYGRVSEKQAEALENMLEGVKKWVRD